MKALIIGTSGIGLRHARNIRKLRDDCHFSAVRTEHNDSTREMDMTLFPDLDAALAENPDAAIIALPPVMHGDVASQCLEAGVAVYLEKPVAMYTADLSQAAQRASERGIPTMVGCMLRMMPVFQKIKEIVTAQHFGSVRHASLRVGQWLPNWRQNYNWQEGYAANSMMGGGALRILIHEIDMARFLFGEFPHVVAQGMKSGALELDCEDVADVLLRRDDLCCNVHVDYLDRATFRAGRILCDEGVITYDATDSSFKTFDARTENWKDHFESNGFSGQIALYTAMSHFLDCVDRKEETEQPLSEGLASLRLVEQALKSAGLEK